ncbi:MAG: hypothetical protein ACHQRM_07995 [Bacteroidia bacterium]
MKKLSLLLFSMVGILAAVYSQQAPTVKKTTFSVKELSKSAWNTADGIPYKQVPGANLGVTSFVIMDNNRVAYLSDASNEILLVDRTNGKTNSKFTVKPGPRDFVYEQGVFFLLGENKVYLYDETGKLNREIAFPGTYLGVGRIARHNKATWLLLPSGNSVELETGKQVTGWITSGNHSVSAVLSGGNSYTLSVIQPDGKKSEKTFQTDKKTAGVYIIGSDKDRIILDVQTYVSESPIRVERHLIALSLHHGVIGDLTSDIKIPDCYYVLSGREFILGNTGTVYHMITSPKGVNLYSLTETELVKAKSYPADVSSILYHFNDHLSGASEKN